ncbi:hypothetical protein BG004_004427 [Podila humilis]|nr:hypothetical protein BG004_004427 [Podila humilis]
MDNFPFHILHLRDSITKELSFKDLVACIRVNRHWYGSFIPVLFQDIITYRSKPLEEEHRWDADDYSLSPDWQRGYQMHACHIRAITCYGRHSLVALAFSHCPKLCEINYTIDENDIVNDGNESDIGLQDLAGLVESHPGLQSISIEGIQFMHESSFQQLLRFLEFLKRYPSVTNVHIEPDLMRDIADRRDWDYVVTRVVYWDPPDYSHYVKPTKKWIERWCTLQQQLLSRIQLHTTRRLHIRTRVPRSQRNSGRRRDYSARESALVLKYRHSDNVPRELAAPPNGRWEAEKRYPAPPSIAAVSALENDGALGVVLPWFVPFEDWIALLEQVPNLKSIQIDMISERVGYVLGFLPSLLPNLTDVGIKRYDGYQESLSQFFQDSSALSFSVTQFDFDQFSCFLGTGLARHAGTLTSLHFVQLWMQGFQKVMTLCSQLESIVIKELRILGSETSSLLTPPWTCRNLRKFDLQLVHGKSLHFHDSDYSSQYYADAADRMAPSFLANLGALSRLTDLCYRVHEPGASVIGVFLELSMDPDRGFPKLAGLSQLRTVMFSGFTHCIGQTEIEWMKNNWPRLITLEVPVLYKRGHEQTWEIEWYDGFNGKLPEYEQWFPGLKVLAPDHCFSVWDGEMEVMGPNWPGTVYTMD